MFLWKNKKFKRLGEKKKDWDAGQGVKTRVEMRSFFFFFSSILLFF